MSTTHPNSTAEATVAHLQREWILHWDKRPGQQLPAFEDVFADYYDFDAAVILFDDFDPQRREFGPRPGAGAGRAGPVTSGHEHDRAGGCTPGPLPTAGC